MRGVCWGRGVVVVAIAVGAVVGAPGRTDASPAVGPPDSLTAEVPVTIRAACNGAPPADFPFVATLPTSVRAGRPFPVQIALAGFPLPSTASGYVRLSIGGGTASEATIAVEGSSYLVATWTPRQQFTLAVAGFGILDASQFIDETCLVDAPVALASIPVRHATPFDAAQLTAHQRTGLLCLRFPGGRPSLETQDVFVTVPNQAHVGEPFTIDDAGGVSVTGGVRSGQTITPTGAVGDTVEFSYDGSFTQTFPPPFPPAPLLICDQQGGPIHIASVPIVAH